MSNQWENEVETRLIKDITFKDSLNTLSPRDRMFIVDFLVRGLMHTELVEKYGICPLTVRKRISRILKRLELYLSDRKM